MLCLLFRVSCQKRTVFAVPALRAEALILNVVHRVDGDLRALKDELAVDLAPVADGLAAAGTDGFQFLDRVGKLQQSGRTGEAAHHKVGAQTVADDRDAEVDRDEEQLLGLFGREELALVAEDAGGLAVLGYVSLDKLDNVHVLSLIHILVGGDFVMVGFKPAEWEKALQ